MKISDLKQAANAFGNIEFLARQVVEGFITGLHMSPYHGFSVEFAEHRQYNTGESTRHIDWKVYSKTDKVFVKRYEEETNLRCMIILDISPSMYYPRESNNKLIFSVLSAAAITYMLQKQRDAVGLTTFSDSIKYQSLVKSTSLHMQEIFMELKKTTERKPGQETTSAYKIIDQIADNIHRRSLVVLFSDMFEDFENVELLFNSLKHLKHNKHEILIFHVKDSDTEDLFNFEERPMIFSDVETGEKIKLNPGQIRDGYVNAVAKFSKDLKVKCGQYKIDFVEVDAAMDFNKVLLPFLAKRQKM